MSDGVTEVYCYHLERRTLEDVLPTLLDLLGAKALPHLDGKSLAPFVRGAQPQTWRDAAH